MISPDLAGAIRYMFFPIVMSFPPGAETIILINSSVTFG